MTAAEPSARIDPQLLARLREWEGRSETLHEQIGAAPVRGLSATLDRPGAVPSAGDELPPLWHWLYFLPQTPQHELGEDGFLPPVPLPRRMWAGGRLQWFAPLGVGSDVEKTSRILSVTHKAGRSGDLVFTTVLHELSVAGAIAVREEQDIVYRAMAQPGEPAPTPHAAPKDAVWSRQIVPDPVLLFRYSALTFNGHRIHYDRRYAIEREAYPSLVVHGPLIATLLADLVVREHPQARFASFSFRAVRPVFDTQPFSVCGKLSADGKGAQLWAQDHEGWLAMQADVRFQ
jgi:3-methylfumaryl-CoA hydratase